MTSRYASDLTDAQWELIAHLIPRAPRIGRPRVVNIRRVFDAILYVLENGIKWRNLPHDFFRIGGHAMGISRRGA